MAGNTPLVNGVNWAWKNVTLVLFGVPITGITKISYTTKQDKANNYGAGSKPVSRGYGNEEYEGSIEIYRDEWEKVIRASGGSPLDIPPFDIPVVFGAARATAGTDILQMCEFLEDPLSTSQGDTKILLTIPLIIGNIIHV
jgi:hypothetical protein